MHHQVIHVGCKFVVHAVCYLLLSYLVYGGRFVGQCTSDFLNVAYLTLYSVSVQMCYFQVTWNYRLQIIFVCSLLYLMFVPKSIMYTVSQKKTTMTFYAITSMHINQF